MIALVVLNWNESDVVLASLKRARNDGVRTVVVDQASTDCGDAFTRPGVCDCYLRNNENTGASRGRNAGITAAFQAWPGTSAILMLDGDILYIPGSADGLFRVLQDNPDAGVAGIHTRGAEDGVLAVDEADVTWPITYTMSAASPIAWTQYGLFRSKVATQCSFEETGYLGMPGWGHEDDDYWFQMVALGFKSYYVDGPVYYHERHSSWRALQDAGIPLYIAERCEQLKEKWGLASDWHGSWDYLVNRYSTADPARIYARLREHLTKQAVGCAG